METIIARVIIGVYGIALVYFLSRRFDPDGYGREPLLWAIQVVARIIIFIAAFAWAITHAF